MTKGGSKYMKIKINIETGELVKVTDENNRQATKLTPQELQKLYQNQDGFKFVAMILEKQINPKCFYFVFQGSGFRLCL